MSALHEILESKDVKVVGELTAISEAMEVRRRESVAHMPPLGAAMLERRSRARFVWLALAAVVLIAAIIAMQLR